MKMRIDKDEKHKLPPDLARKRRERRLIVIISIIIVLLTYLGTYLTYRDLKIGIGENILLIAIINVNIILLVIVIFLVIRNFVKLVFERKHKVYGAGLRTTLAMSFAGMTLFPTLIMFLAAMFFFSMTMDKFFNIQVERSLEYAKDIAQTYYALSTESTLNSARRVGDSITELDYLNADKRGLLKEHVKKQRELLDLDLIKVYSPEMEELASVAGEDMPTLALERLDPSFFEDAVSGSPNSNILNTGYGDVVWALYPTMTSDKKVTSILMVATFIPKSLIPKMIEIRYFLEEYRKNKIFKQPVLMGYIIALAAIALLVVFTATWLGLYIAKEITVPIALLAKATKDVAGGDLDVYIDAQSKDEIGILVDAFNTMTQDLKIQSRRLNRAYTELSQSNLELDQRGRYMEIVLRNVAAGGISVDKNEIVTTVNRSAERVLGIKTSKVIGRSVREVLKSKHYQLVMNLIDELKETRTGFVQRQVEIPLDDRTLILMANLNNLVDEDGGIMGVVAVFDDITEIMRAQKVAAWREVARRIAHEIKNPLTPIQLSAQRIRKKYLDKLGDDKGVLDDCTATIITQVEEMKTLVNEFSLFARMPASRPRANKLNDIVREVLTLYQDTNKKITYHFKEDPNLPLLSLDREQMKRVLINLIDNAIDSIEDTGEITIETRYVQHIKTVKLIISDSGQGIKPEGKQRLFEPYYSTKKSGTGLGLTIVNAIVSDHRGYIRVSDNEPRGAKFTIDLPVST